MNDRISICSVSSYSRLSVLARMRCHAVNYVLPVVQFEEISCRKMRGVKTDTESGAQECFQTAPQAERIDAVRERIYFDAGTALQEILHILSAAELVLPQSDFELFSDSDAIIWYLDIICRCGNEDSGKRDCVIKWVVSFFDSITDEVISSHQEEMKVSRPIHSDSMKRNDGLFRELLYRQILAVISRQQAC